MSGRACCGDEIAKPEIILILEADQQNTLRPATRSLWQYAHWLPPATNIWDSRRRRLLAGGLHLAIDELLHCIQTGPLHIDHLLCDTELSAREAREIKGRRVTMDRQVEGQPRSPS